MYVIGFRNPVPELPARWIYELIQINARLIVRHLGRVGDARASATIQNSESTHRGLRRVYENAAEHYRCIATSGKHGRRH